MKSFKILAISFLVLLFASTISFAQTSKEKEVKFLTSAHCGSCKAAIEKAAKGVDGVSFSEVNLENKVVTVKFDPSKTSEEKIKAAIVKAGYKAELYAGKDDKGNESGCKNKCKNKCKEKSKCSENKG
jgi:periplasmic mercuric ion binding protein